jgi:TRAP transporter TAXI family solute receptor
MRQSVRLGISAFLLWAGYLSSSQEAVALEGMGRVESGRSTTASSFTARLNAGAIGIISGGVDGTYVRIAADIANVLDDQSLRVLAVIGRGSVHNMRDLMFLRGIDIGIVQMDARASLAAENLGSAADLRLRYIAPLYNEEVHILADRNITNLSQLQGRRVGIDKQGSGTNLTARNIFSKLGIQPDFVELDQTASYAALRAGDVAAAIYVAGRPVRAISDFKYEGRFHLLGIPFAGELADTYLPSRFTLVDYPGLLDDDKPIETLAVGSILAAFNWPMGSDRYRRVARFVDAFFFRFPEFLKPGRHPKWKEVNIYATVPGWQRCPAAQRWLDRNAAPALSAASSRAAAVRP